MKDLTEKYKYMIQAFECDFKLAISWKRDLSQLDLNDHRVSNDICLLQDLSNGLRHGNLQIVEVEDNDDVSNKRLKNIISNLLCYAEDNHTENISKGEMIFLLIESGDFTEEEIKSIDKDIYEEYLKWMVKDEDDPEYGHCTTCEHHGNCTVCSDCHEGNRYNYEK